MTIRKRGSAWQADTCVDGVRKRRSFKTQEDAQAWLEAVEGGYEPTNATTLGAFINDQFDFIWGDAKRPDAPATDLKVVQQYIPGTTQLSAITTQTIATMISRMKADGKANATINRKLSALSKLLRHARWIKTIATVPEFRYLKEPKGRERVWSKADEQRALVYLSRANLYEASLLCIFLLYTGCRLGDAYNLRRSDVKDGRATFRATKNDTTRTIKLPREALEAWLEMARLHPIEHPFRGYSRDTFRNHWRLLRCHMGAEDDPAFVPHMLRHTCATRLVLGGVDLPRVMKWMGHKNIQTTMRYAHLISRDVDMCADILEAA